MKQASKNQPTKSPIKVVLYFKCRPDGRAFYDEEIRLRYNRKVSYMFCYFPKMGGGHITDHEKAFNNAEKYIKDNIKNIFKAMIFLVKENGDEFRIVNYIDKYGWQFFHRPQFITTIDGHRYISKYEYFDETPFNPNAKHND